MLELPHEPETLDDLVNQVVAQLAQYPNTMLQFKPHEIKAFVENGLGTMLIHPENPKKLVAFAKLFQWPGQNQRGQLLLELGSWIVPADSQGFGWGKQVLIETVKKGKQIFPEAQIVGVIESSNQASQGVMVSVGGSILEPEAWPSNLEIVLQDGQAQVVVIDVTNVA